jgi:uncharacterized membrane protein YgdD (TMEM256/DUF423 family)
MSTLSMSEPELKQLRRKMRFIVWAHNLKVIHTSALIVFDSMIEVMFKILKWTIAVLFLGLVIL